MDIILAWDQLETERLFFSFWFATGVHKAETNAFPYQVVTD